MTRYCGLALKLTPDLNIEDTLSQFAETYFGAIRAVQIDEYQFDIDNGLNNLRAIIKPEQGLIAFCCRYERDVPRTEAKLEKFIELNQLNPVLCIHD